MIGSPICKKCNNLLTEDNWYPSHRKHHHYICNTCAKARTNEYNRTHPSTIKCLCGCGQYTRRGKKWIGGHRQRTKEFRTQTSKWNHSPENIQHLKELHVSPEGKAQLEKLHETWARSPAGKANAANQLIKWSKSPEGKALFSKRSSTPEHIARLLNYPRSKITYGKCGVSINKHRSKDEIEYCTALQINIKKELIHSCVVIGRKEIDFVIGQSWDDPRTWIKAIELHAIYWDTFNGVTDYEKTRTEQLRTMGVTCPIEIIIRGKKRAGLS